MKKFLSFSSFRLQLIVIIFISVVCRLSVSAQMEKVYLDLDKYSCTLGDTVWFKAVITQSLALSNTSTNLYVNTYTKTGHLLSKQVFPIYRGLSQ